MRHLLRLLIAGTISLVVILIMRQVNGRTEGTLPVALGGRGTLLGAAPDGLPVLGEVPAFALVERSGRPLTRADLAGKPWIASFVFSRCGDQCPRMMERLRRVADALATVPEVRFVSFTLDPVHDTPEVLERYAADHRAPKDRWLFATGARDALVSLSIDGFHLGAAGAEKPEEIIHSARFTLVDGAGRIRGYYDGDGDAADEHMRRLAADARALVQEASEAAR